jgi:hypothetical protein
MADFPITLSRVRVTPLTNPERHNGFTHKFTIKAADVAVASATGSTDTVTVTLCSTPANWIVPQAMAVIRTAFAGTTALTVQVGGTTANAFLAATSVLTAGKVVPSGGMNSVNTVASAHATAAQTIKATFTNATGGSPSAVSAGEVDIFLSILDATKIG